MESHDFLRLLINSICLIGNSSVGIRECAYMGVPVVNIGTRQNRRQRGMNVTDVNYSSIEIREAILSCKNNPKPDQSDVYGSGNSGEKIANLLSEIDLTSIKTIMY